MKLRIIKIARSRPRRSAIFSPRYPYRRSRAWRWPESARDTTWAVRSSSSASLR